MARSIGQRGITITEVVIAVGLASIVIYAGSVAMVQFTKNSKDLGAKSLNDVSSASLSRNFSLVMEGADIAVKCEHLPIQVSGCVDGHGVDPLTKPCLRQLSKTNSFSAVDLTSVKLVSGEANPAYLEFFRDDNAKLSTTPAWGNASTAVIQSSTPVTLTNEALNGNYYVTWPLSDENSPPFVVLSNPGTKISLTYDSSTSMSSPPADNSFVFFTSSQKIDATELAGLKGSLVVVFNAYAVQHYVFQLVGDSALDCSLPDTTSGGSSGASQCKSKIYWSATPAQKEEWNRKFMAANPPYYALRLGAVTTSHHFKAHGSGNAYVPSMASLGLSGSSAGLTWPFQPDSSFFLFLTQTPSLFDRKSPDFSYPTGTDHIDLRRLGHYYDVSNRNGKSQLTAIPVRANAYYLKKRTTPQGATVHDLVMTTFNDFSKGSVGRMGDPEVTIMPTVPGKVVFARKLGSNDFTIFMFKSASANPGVKPATAMNEKVE